MTNLLAWKSEFEQELKHNILSFWLQHAPDEQYGGFRGLVTRDLTVVPEADKSLVLNTRILWTFSSAYRIDNNPAYIEMADRAYEYLQTHFIDPVYDGLYWMLSANGEASEKKKQIYGQAFAVYAYTEYYRATGKQEALEHAKRIFKLIEKHGFDPEFLGYYEALSEDWTETDDMSLSGKDMNEKKSMNTHLHVMEAYTNLYRVWKDEWLEKQLKSLIEITMKYIVNTESGHFKLFFNEQWDSQSAHISYGHDIEGSWLLVEAAEVLDDKPLLDEVKKVAIQMAEAVYQRGIDTDGAILNEAEGDELIDDHKDWWPQAEAVVGFFNAYQLVGEQKYLDAARNAWTFIQKHIVDHEYGEWHWSTKRDGTPSDNEQKISAWKCPYHNARACFEMIERIQHLSSVHH